MASSFTDSSTNVVEPRLDFVRLALTLSGATDTSAALRAALETLEQCAPAFGWALLFRRAPGRFAATAGRDVGQRKLRQLTDGACASDPWLCLDRTATESAGRGDVVFVALPEGDDRGDDEPELIVGCWPPEGTDAQGLPRQLATAARLILATLRSADSFERLLDQNSRDTLTGLLNRRGTLDALARETARARRVAIPVSVLFLDLDGFKEINDRHSHLAGDQILSAVGARLARLLRASDAVGRIGGDEFLVVLGDTDLEAAWRIGRRLDEGLRARPLWCSAGPVWLGLTCGAASQEEHLCGEALIELADRRMLERKRARRNSVPDPADDGRESPRAAAR